MEINWNHICLYIQCGGITFQSCREGTWTYDPLCESGHASFLLSSSSPPLHFTSTGSGVCQHPPSSQTGLFNHLNTNPTCLYHTMQVSVSRLDNHTPSPLDPSHQNSSSALLFKHCARTHINTELVFWQLNVKNITISQCFVSCQIQPVSQEEWGRASSYVFWLALRLRPQKFPCNLASKWSRAGCQPKQTTLWRIHIHSPLTLLILLFQLLF